MDCAVRCGRVPAWGRETQGMTIANGTERVTLVPVGAWEVDPARSAVGFAVRHLKVTKVRGRFGEITGVIRCDRDGMTSMVDMTPS